jgi:PAS domain S-box-containing protein
MDPKSVRQYLDEHVVSRHASSLLNAMSIMYNCNSLDDGINQILTKVIPEIGADTALLLHKSEDSKGVVLLSKGVSCPPQYCDESSQVIAAPQLVADLSDVSWQGAIPFIFNKYCSHVSVPLQIDGGQPMVFVYLAERQNAFESVSRALLVELARIVSQVATAQFHPVESNMMLNSALGHANRMQIQKDTTFAALTKAYGHLADWQAATMEISNELLSSNSNVVDLAVTQALARTGLLADSDRTYVFRLSGGRLNNTHEWVAPGIDPMIDHLQDLPAEIMAEWLPELESARAVEIPSILALPEESQVREILLMQGIKSLLVVPMMRNGRLAGFVGYDAVRVHREFLPMEVQLLKFMANTINVVLDRAVAEHTAEVARIKLEVERDRLQATLAALPELVLEIDQSGRFVSYNVGAKLAPAFEPQKFLGRLPEDVLPPYLSGIMRRLMQQVADKSGFQELEYDMMVDGEKRSYFVTAAPKLASGDLVGYIFVVRDVTARRRQQKEIVRLSKIAELTSNLVVVTDAAGLIEWVNPAFEQRTGWKLEEIRGRKPGEFLQSNRTDQNTIQRISKAIRSAEPIQEELLNRSKYGEEYWVSKDIQPLFGEGGQIEGFISVQTDITTLKRSHQIALRDRAMAMDASSDGIAISDASGHFTYMNKACRQMFGILTEVDIRSLAWVDLVPGGATDEFLRRHWKELEKTGSWRGELSGLSRTGASLQIDSSLTLKDDGGLLWIVRDVSQRLKVEMEKAQLREKLQLAQRQETISHVALGVAHDLNNFVAVVAGTATLLESHCHDNEDVMAGLARIGRATEFAKDLVTGLGKLGRSPSQRSQCDLCSILQSSKELIGTNRVEDYSIKLALDSEALPVWADATEMLQVVLNLALNACDAGPPDTNKVTITAYGKDAPQPDRTPDVGKLSEGSSYSFFSISDTGEGVTPEIRQRLFERYFTTKGAKGTGLGLPIVISILHGNDAALWFDSCPGDGTKVTIAWPCNESRVEFKPRIQRTNHPKQSDLAGHNLLVVDDNPDVADVLAEMLELGGAVVIALTDPLEAKELMEEESGIWSALITDFHMPGLNGAELAKVAGRLSPKVPTILVTALPEMAQKHCACFDAVVSKPTDATQIIDIVKGVVL